MTTPNFPIPPEEDRGFLCAWCRSGHKLLEPHSFAGISCGAILLDAEDRSSGGPSDDMEGYLSLSWHGAHADEGGVGKNPDIYLHLPLKSAVVGGQMDIFFCSTDCLRAFLNHSVDELERRVAAESG
jgi:hypothetical protein